MSTTTTTARPKFVVCPECAGEGSFGPGFTWTRDEIDADPEGFEETQALLREGFFDQPCATCSGKRVVVDVEEFDGVTTTAEERWAEESEIRAVERAERAFGC